MEQIIKFTVNKIDRYVPSFLVALHALNQYFFFGVYWGRGGQGGLNQGAFFFITLVSLNEIELIKSHRKEGETTPSASSPKTVEEMKHHGHLRKTRPCW